MEKVSYDLIVIGSGPGGYSAAIRAGQYGLKTALIEKQPKLGGTCLLVGCVPTKALLHTADVWDHFLNPEADGIHCQNPVLDYPKVIDKKNRIVNKHSKGVEGLLRKNKVEWIKGYARLKGGGRIEVETPQGPRVRMEGRGEILILSSNNYLGLCAEPSVVQAGVAGLQAYGAGTSSVRFICGTYAIHRTLEAELARFVGTEASLSFGSAWNANEGLTASVVGEGDVVLSDALNHASIIDSMRLAKAITKCTTAVYRHGDMDDLVSKLESARGARRTIIWTDGVFSMEGSIAKLPSILEIARRFGAIVAVDDSHATGVIGETGRGTPEHCGVLGDVDVITSTLGKALGGAAGGFVAGPESLCDMLTQRSRLQPV